MTKKKQRVYQHIMEDESYKIIRDSLPSHWVVREFNKPDYGIDLIIELFDKKDDSYSEVLGEYIYVQVKSVNNVTIQKKRIYSVGNVAKQGWKEDKEVYSDLEVIKFVMDSSSLYTIQALGASISVILFIVDLSLEEVYYICLNDYIDKILLPQDFNFSKSKSKTLYIPTYNKVSDKAMFESAFSLYGKRSKLLSAFSLISYQKNEIMYLIQDSESLEFIKIRLNYFISLIENLEIWNNSSWKALFFAKQSIINFKKLINSEDVEKEVLIMQTHTLWNHLNSLNSVYEEICREYFLPKIISILTCYPNSQIVHGLD